MGEACVVWGISQLKLANGVAVIITSMLALVTNAQAQSNQPARPVSIRAGSFGTIVSLRGQSPTRVHSAISLAASQRPRPRLVGPSPLVAITTSDRKRPNDFEFEHDLHFTYVGQPLNFPASANFVVGILDSGAVVDLTAGSANATLGLTGAITTGNVVPIGGVGGMVDAQTTFPVGYFAQGLWAIQSDGTLNLPQLVGHSNVSLLVANPIDCGNGEALTAVVGTPFMSFFDSIIRVDRPITVTVAGVTYHSPEVIMQAQFGQLPTITHSIAIELGGLAPVTTSTYFPDFEDLVTPVFPTQLAAFPGTLPTGALFFADILVSRDEPTPSNPAQLMRVLVDTGAQSSIMSPALAANLSLPIDPDFSVDVCGVGGFVTQVPGYYLDFVRMNALGGALEFSHAPFIVIDLQSPEGGSLDGVLGMNFFWNRNMVIEPQLLGSSFFSVSDPIPFAYADFDVDFDVDCDDYVTMMSCLTRPGQGGVSPDCDHLDVDFDGAIDLHDFAAFQSCFSGAGHDADPDCGR